MFLHWFVLSNLQPKTCRPKGSTTIQWMRKCVENRIGLLSTDRGVASSTINKDLIYLWHRHVGRWWYPYVVVPGIAKSWPFPPTNQICHSIKSRLGCLPEILLALAENQSTTATNVCFKPVNQPLWLWVNNNWILSNPNQVCKSPFEVIADLSCFVSLL